MVKEAGPKDNVLFLLHGVGMLQVHRVHVVIEVPITDFNLECFYYRAHIIKHQCTMYKVHTPYSQGSSCTGLK